MNQLYAQGILVSLGPKHNSETLKQIPSNRLFLETDGQSSINDLIRITAISREETVETINGQIICNNDSFLLQEP